MITRTRDIRPSRLSAAGLRRVRLPEMVVSEMVTGRPELNEPPAPLRSARLPLSVDLLITTGPLVSTPPYAVRVLG